MWIHEEDYAMLGVNVTMNNAMAIILAIKTTQIST